jgi:hypothetical protein
VPLAHAGLAYRRAELVERRLGRRPGRPRALPPLSVQRDAQATGLRRLGSMALRGVTLLACVGRRRLTAAGTTLAGLDAGKAKRATARPPAERRRETWQESTLTSMAGAQQT